jgi:glutamate synthase (NADPH) small chain
MNNIGQITKLTLSERKTTFREVSCGFNEEEAIKEAGRCLQCKASPCSTGCPAGIDVKEFIHCIREKNYPGAIAKIREANSLPAVCGRVCPQEEQCQLACILNKKGHSIQIGYLERFVADRELTSGQRLTTPDRKPEKNVKIAVIGSGPAGLSCAADLARVGFDVHIFEALHRCGGVLVYGIPEFRLPKSIVAKEVEYIKTLNVKVNLDFVAGKTRTIDDLRREEFKAFFIAVGAGLPQFLNIPGENLNGVYSANEFLTRVNLMKAYDFPHHHTPIKIGKKIAVFGAGNVAFDCTRCALRLGAEEVHIVYRRTRNEMPARIEEVENAEEEGVIFDLLVSPKEILADKNGNVTGVVCVKNELGQPDASGRRSPIPIAGSDFVLDADTVIVAVGTKANPLLISAIKDLALSKNGYIQTNQKSQTSIPDIFAGGDIVTGSATVISAINHGRAAAKSITEYLTTEQT